MVTLKRIVFGFILLVSSCQTSISDKPHISFSALYTNDTIKYWDRYNPFLKCIGRRRIGFVFDIKKHMGTYYEYQGNKRISPIHIQGIGKKRIVYKGYYLADKQYWNKTGDSLFDCYHKVKERSKVIKLTKDTLVIVESSDGDSKDDTVYYIASRDQTTRPIVVDSNGTPYCDYTHIIPFDSILK